MKLLLPQAVTVEAVLYTSWAGFTAVQTWFANDDVYKYVSPHTVFWIRGVCGVVAAMAGALKIFMSTSWGKHLQEQNGHSQSQGQPEVKTGTVKAP